MPSLLKSNLQPVATTAGLRSYTVQNGQVTDLVAGSRIVRSKMRRTINRMAVGPGQYIHVPMADAPWYAALIADMAATAAIFLT